MFKACSDGIPKYRNFISYILQKDTVLLASVGSFRACDFETDGDQYGSFSFKPTNSSEKIKCSKFVQTGFQNIEISYLIYSHPGKIDTGEIDTFLEIFKKSG